MKSVFRVFATVMAAAIFSAGIAGAQTRVDAKKDWSIFEAGEGAKKVCWIVSQPTKSVAKRDGRNVQVKRGDIFLMVAIRKADGVKNEVSFLAGYPFKKGSKVKVSVNVRGADQGFTMFTDGENAWTSSPQEDDALAGAFRAGRTARMTGVSQRGTTTVDTFSLSGFTAAFKEATNRCK